jgi:hypothetical protein
MVSNNVLNFYGSLDANTLSYVNVNITKVADIVTQPNTAIFTGASVLLAPSFLPPTNVSNFNFFINNQHIPSSQVTLTSYIDRIEIVFDTDQIGFTLLPSDEVIAIGKFQQ